MPICLAGRRPATASLAQMHACDLNIAIDLRGLRQIPAPAADQSCAAASSAIALIGVARRHPALPHANPHNARGTVACQFPRFRSLKAFGRRPRCTPHRRDRPASETLNNRVVCPLLACPLRSQERPLRGRGPMSQRCQQATSPLFDRESCARWRRRLGSTLGQPLVSTWMDFLS